MNELKVIPSVSELESMLMLEDDPNKLDELLEVFKAYDKKREMLKLLKIGKLQDQVLDQMEINLEVPGEIADKDLVSYLKVLEDAETKQTSSKFDGIKPTIQINQQFNGESQLSKESRENVVSFIQNLLYNTDSTTVNTDNVEDEVEEDDND